MAVETAPAAVNAAKLYAAAMVQQGTTAGEVAGRAGTRTAASCSNSCSSGLEQVLGSTALLLGQLAMPGGPVTELKWLSSCMTNAGGWAGWAG